LEYGQTKVQVSSSNVYIENDAMTIKNTVSSSHSGHSASFERQVYISKVALYDDDKKLIGVASMSSPVLKKEAQSLSFKLKLDL
jgi:ribosomal protein L24